ncbi:DMT family transporter [Lampropedia hyalina]|uniref:DMT family transporter n=1 Tax=Lampropedia hyalina TaxID=198706 RepID=UPI001F2250BB|nr:DMT family transporter [Lampropedia hyalina]
MKNHSFLSGASRITIGILCGAGAGAVWGLVFLAPELVRGFGPLHLATGRYLCYGLLSLVLLAPRWRKVVPRLTRQQWVGIISLALIGNLLYYVLLSAAVQWGGIAMTSLVIGFLPVWVTIIGSRDRHAVPLRALTPSLVCCALGAFCIGWQVLAMPAPGVSLRHVAGLGCAVGALLAWTWFAVANSRWLARVQHVGVHDWNLLMGIVTGAMVVPLIPVAIVLDATPHTAADWWQFAAVVATLALLASIVGNGLWNRMSRLLPLTLAGQMILFETLFALLYGFLWEQRWPTGTELAAFAFLCLGVVSCVAAHQRHGRHR